MVKVLLTVTSTRLNYGGPAVSVPELGRALANAGHEVALWSPDQSAISQIVGEPGLYPFGGTFLSTLSEFGSPDVVHDNGLWMPHNHHIAKICRNRGIKRIVSPRGMLSPWALRHKRIKKKLAWIFYQKRDLRIADVLHATSPSEASDLRKLQLGITIRTAANGLSADIFDLASQSPGIELNSSRHFRTALFLGRVYPVKGLANLIRAWDQVRPTGWILNIVGPDEAGHKAELVQIVEKLGLSYAIKFEDAVQGQDKWDKLKSADLFVLPSLSENFSMSVAEALCVGLPVVTTTATPWKLIQDRGLGWWVPPLVDDLARAIREATQLPNENLSQMGEKARAEITNMLAWPQLIPKYLNLYGPHQSTNNKL